MAEGLQIAPLTVGDIPEVIALAREIWHLHYPGIVPAEQIEYMLNQRYTAERLGEELNDPTIAWEVASLGQRRCGFSSTHHLAATHELKLDKLYVHPDVHGHGVGRALVERVEARATALACPTLVLAVNKYNEKAIAAYRRMGFAVREAKVTDIGHGFVMDDFIMIKTLS